MAKQDVSGSIPGSCIAMEKRLSGVGQVKQFAFRVHVIFVTEGDLIFM